jgi:DNA repair protein RadC
MHYLIRDLNQNEKPREKLSKHGAVNLTDVELIALLLRSGGKGVSAIDLSRNLLDKFGGLNNLATADLQQIGQTKYIDVAKASSLVAAFEIAARTNIVIKKDLELIRKPEDAVDLLKKDLFRKQKEHLYLLSLNSRSRLLAKDLITVGTINETLLSPREVFRQAFMRNAVSMIIAHNHPSNDPTPSTEDIEITQKLSDVASEMGIPLLDHLVIAEDSYVSMKAQGLMKSNKLDQVEGGE